MVAGVSRIGIISKAIGKVGVNALNKTGKAVSYPFLAAGGVFPLNGTRGQQFKHCLISNSILGVCNGLYSADLYAKGSSGLATLATGCIALNFLNVIMNYMKLKLNR